MSSQAAGAIPSIIRHSMKTVKSLRYPFKWILMAVIAVGLPLLVEVILNAGALMNPQIAVEAEASSLERTADPVEGREKYQINADTVLPVNGTERITYENPVYLKLPLNNAYINHLTVSADADHDINYTLLLDTWSIYGQEKYTEKDDKISYVLKTGVTHLSDKVDNLYLVMEEEDSAFLTTLTASNRFEFQWQRFLLLFAGFSGLGILILFKELLVKRLELLFLCIGLPFGIALTFSHGISPNSWDEQVHFSCVYQMSYFGNVAQSEAYGDYCDLTFPSNDTMEEQEWIRSWADTASRETGREAPSYPYTTVYGRVGYVFQAIGMALARLFGAPFSVQIYVSNLFNLACYLALMTFAIRRCRFGKYAMFFIGLMPIQFVLATSFSYDAFVNAFLMLGYALFTEEFASEERINYKRTIIGILAMVVGILPKAVYFPLLFLFCFLPKEKFGGKRERVVFFILVAICAALLALTFVLPTILSGSGGSDLYSDPRRPGSNAYQQLMMILTAPFKYLRMLFSNIVSWQLPYYFGNLVWTNYVYPGRYVGTGLYLIPVMFTFIAATEGDREDAGKTGLKKFKIGSVILMFLALCLVWTSLYLAFNPVGAERIKGVQGRYLIPCSFLVMLLFFNKKIRCSLSEAAYRRIIAGSALFICFSSMWSIYFGNEWYNVI